MSAARPGDARGDRATQAEAGCSGGGIGPSDVTESRDPGARRKTRRGRRPRSPAAMRLAAIEGPVAPFLRRSARLTAAAALLWPVQAGALAWAVAGWVEARASLENGLLAALVFLLAAAIRAALDHRAGALAFEAADRALAAERARLVEAESLRGEAGAPPGAPEGAAKGASAAASAAMAAQKLPMLAPYLTRYRPAALRAVVGPLAILAVALPISWAVGLILLVAGPLIPVFMALIGVAASKASRRQLDEISDLNALLMERLAALPDIRLLDAGARLERDFAARSDGLRARTMAVLKVAFLSSTVLELFAALGIAIAAVYVGFSLLGQIGFGAWSSPLTLVEGLFLLLLAPEFFQPLREFAAAWHDRAAAVAVAGELAEAETAAPPRILGRGAPSAPLPGPAGIRLSGVVARGRALPDLQVAPGASLAITGPSGAGKSTLLALLAGLSAPQAGRIEVAGRALDDESADAWRARLAWIPQTPHFPDAPLRDVLDPRGTADLDAALEAAGAAAVVAALPEGLETRLGERGAGVSGGEARRLMVARALAARPDVLLADEPTADLDPATAAAVIAGLRLLAARGTTVIAATHDPAVVAALGAELTLAPAAPAPDAEADALAGEGGA
ncbi:ATP-binding cassette domain-containing protein [Albimonas sp. CAU 1670]|uniref:ABC transporter ATP-binding protein/permease n=1 Tax=Albimonas sp. CAU 1670 TaxID=3032599 RepID=UPI0023DA61D5|nr:ATP-binding cassette domain-containing protein [Albimonas sp. CAU 1670]MDF2231999.1 ATP-binding cassette domain-containing protein [Albimonas sp. CAU 1670]